MVDAINAYAKAMSSSVRFVITENERMAKELQEAKQREEQSTWSVRAEMKMAIFAKVLALETVIWRLYDNFATMHKEFVHLHGHQ